MKLEEMTHEQVMAVEFRIDDVGGSTELSENEVLTAEDIMGIAVGKAQLMVYESPSDSINAQDFLLEIDSVGDQFDGALVKRAIIDILEATSIYVEPIT